MNFLDEKPESLRHLLGTAGRILERAIEDKPHNDERIRDGIGLLKRCIWSASTALQLFESRTRVPQFEEYPFIDCHTIGQICRTVFETVLSFHYAVYAPGVSQDELMYRHSAWRLGGYLARWESIQDSSQYPAQYAREQAIIQDLQNRMSSTQFFQTFTEKQKRSALQNAHWRGPGGNLPWYEMARAAGLGEAFAKTGYGFQSQMVHSTSLSVFQVLELDPAAQLRHADNYLLRILMYLAVMVRWFTEFYPPSAMTLDLDIRGKPVQEFFEGIARKMTMFD